MTTKVIILNQGPDSILITPRSQDWEGLPLAKLKKNEFVEMHVHSSQDLVLQEIKEEVQQTN